MKKWFKLATVVTTFSAMALAGCSNNSASKGGADSDTLTFMFRGGEDEKKAYQAAISEFEKNEGVKVKIVATDADQYATKLQAAISGGKVPDVFYVEQGSVMAYVDNGV